METVFKIGRIGALLLALGSNSLQSASRIDEITNLDDLFKRLKFELTKEHNLLHYKGSCMKELARKKQTQFNFPACWLQMRKPRKKSARI